MCKKSIYLISLVLALMAFCRAQADTIAYWRFDDVGDTDIEQWGPVLANNPLPDSDGWTVWRKAVHDHSGNGNHLTTWEYAWAGFTWSSDVPSAIVPTTGASNALSMASAGNYPASMTWSEQSLPGGIDIETITPAEFTIEASFKPTYNPADGYHTIVGRDGMNVATVLNDATKAPLYFSTRPGASVAIEFSDMAGNNWQAVSNGGLVTAGRWYNMVGVSDGSTLSLYLDNVLVAQTAINSADPRLAVGLGSGADWEGGTWSVGRGLWNGGHVDRVFGYIDEVRISDTALEPSQFLFTPVYARNPTPLNDSLYTKTDVLLLWEAGCYAASHDVYFGDNFADVNNATTSTAMIYKGRQSENYYPTTELLSLELDKYYYWRIDEVNDLHPDSPWRGSVWSFWIPPYKAYEPNPPDEAKFIDTNVTLTWTAGFGARLHTVYFGEDFDTVNNATGGTSKGLIGYNPGPLELNKTYYWRVDEYDGSVTYKGDIWSFRTRPVISITDPNLVGWWKFDEGQGTVALDWSGYGHHATLVGNPQWATGYDGGALALDGADDYVALPIGSVISSLTNSTFTTWVNFSNAGGAWQRIFDFGTGITVNMFLTPRIGTTEPMRFAITTGGAAAEEQATAPDTLPSGWHHVAVTISADTRTITLYLDGVVVQSNPATLTPSDLGNTTNNWLGRSQYTADAYFMGYLDDFRIYDFAMTADEIPETMRGDPMLAWNPNPADGSTPDIKVTLPLSWSPGDKASEHDVYFGTNQEAVENADISDTTGVYRKRQNTTTYTPPEGVEWGQTYYWRIDQYNTDGTVSKGRVWSFMVADFILVDDFEIYNADENQIWYAWRDGLGFGAIVTPPYSPGNGTGSAVGDETTDSYTEEIIVHGGRQSMPYEFNNNKPDKMKYSEAKLTLSDTRDWTEEQVKALSLWFRGYPASVGSFTESPAGTYTMTGSGTDIWDVGPAGGPYHDEFHFAYKQLTGQGTIIARVDSVQNTNSSAKAGVMIRETLDPNSAHAMMVVTPTDGIKFEGRREPGASSFSYTQTGITAPHWVRLERDLAGNFTVSHSANGTTWEEVQNALVESIPMSASVYIGLAVTAHNAAATCQAVFSNVTISGNVSAQWLHQDIGIQSNDPEPMYVAVANNTGTPAVVYHEDPNAAQIDTWTEWNIDLKDFADKGIVLTDVNSIAIGFGNRNNPQAGGSGKMYFDDIRLYRPRYVPGKGTPIAADLNSDGVVDMADVEVMVTDWLATGPALAGDVNTDSTVDLKDYAVLADMWLEEQLWPEW